MNRRQILSSLGALSVGSVAMKASAEKFEVVKTEAEWRKQLSPEAYKVLRDHGTERAGSSPLDREKRVGVFHCAGCDLPLFASQTKFDSGTGWPSLLRT